MMPACGAGDTKGMPLGFANRHRPYAARIAKETILTPTLPLGPHGTDCSQRLCINCPQQLCVLQPECH